MKRDSFHHFWSTLKILTVAAGVVATVVTQAQADKKTYPGSMCKRWFSSTQDFLDSSAIGNLWSNEWLIIHCPIVRAATKNNMVGRIAGGWVQITDKNPNPGMDVVCTLYAVWKYANGASVWASRSLVPSSPTSTRVGDGLIDPFPRLYSMGGDNEYNYFYCAIPPNHYGAVSFLWSYGVEEIP